MTEPDAVHQIGPEVQRRWDAQPGDERLIAQHLLRQSDLAAGLVRLDSGRVVAEGSDANGKGGAG